MTEKLYQKLDQVEIKQSISPIRFKNQKINQICIVFLKVIFKDIKKGI